jgi:hypothetical protein
VDYQLDPKLLEPSETNPSEKSINNRKPVSPTIIIKKTYKILKSGRRKNEEEPTYDRI